MKAARRPVPPAKQSIWHRTLDVVDDMNVHRPADRLESQAKLLLKDGEDGRTGWIFTVTLRQIRRLRDL